MLAKVIAHAPTRAEAARALAGALERAQVHGVTTNRDLLVRILRHPDFLAGDIDTGFLERHDPAVLGAPLADDLDAAAATPWPPPWPARPDAGPRRRVLAAMPVGLAQQPLARRRRAAFDRARRARSTSATASTATGSCTLVAVDVAEPATWRSSWSPDVVALGRDRRVLAVDGVARRYDVDAVGPDRLRRRARRRHRPSPRSRASPCPGASWPPAPWSPRCPAPS